LKIAKLNNYRSWPRYYHDKPVYQISFQYVHLLRRKWAETANNLNFSTSKSHNCRELLDCTQYQTWPRYYYDKPVYQISFQYIHPLRRNERKLLITWIFLRPRAITLSKLLDRTQYQTWPRYYYDKPVHQISFQYVYPLRR